MAEWAKGSTKIKYAESEGPRFKSRSGQKYKTYIESVLGSDPQMSRLRLLMRQVLIYLNTLSSGVITLNITFGRNVLSVYIGSLFTITFYFK